MYIGLVVQGLTYLFVYH